MHECLNGLTHGPVHVAIGGVAAASAPSSSTGAADDERAYDAAGWAGAHREQALLVSKLLWRTGFADCAGASCSCASHLGDSGGGHALLNASGALRFVEQYATALPADDPADGKWDDLASALCGVGRAGDMFSSASPADPLFWLVHGTCC